MFGNTKSNETSGEKIRMVHALLLDTFPDPQAYFQYRFVDPLGQKQMYQLLLICRLIYCFINLMFDFYIIVIVYKSNRRLIAVLH